MDKLPAAAAVLAGLLLGASAFAADVPEIVASTATDEVASESSSAPVAGQQDDAADQQQDPLEPVRRPSEHPMSTPKDWRKRLRMKNPTRTERSAFA